MKYPDNKHEQTALHLLPSFLILLDTRTLRGAMERSTLSPETFLEAIETFLFILINYADPFTMDDHKIDYTDYLKRRNELLKALGLHTYLEQAILMSGKTHPAFTSDN